VVDHPAAADHDQPVGHQRHLGQQVAGDEDRAALAAQLPQHVAQPVDAVRVQAVVARRVIDGYRDTGRERPARARRRVAALTDRARTPRSPGRCSWSRGR